jgi:nucleoid-associated protein YgaU
MLCDVSARAKLLVLAGVSATIGVALIVHAPAVGADADGVAVANATAWCIALTLSLWLATTSTVGCLSARVLPLTPRGVRRLIEVALVGSCVVGSAVPASATSLPVVRDMPVVRAPEPQHPRHRVRPQPPPTTHVVQTGENLWSIAESVAGRDNVFPYWRALVVQNEANLRSGNPDLIYPGEILTLPAQ